MQSVVTTVDAKQAKTLTDSYVQQFCANRAKQALEIGPSYLRLWKSVESLLLAGGKRFRPYMVIAAYQAYNPDGDIEDILPAAVAQELVHSAMLIHDDIIDRDTVRYGVKNISGQYDDIYSEYLHDPTEREHASLSVALLAGDALLSDAHRLLQKTNRPVELVDRAADILTTAIFEVIGGELLDTEVAFLPKGTIKAETIAKYKTGSYSFVSPLTTGAVLADAPKKDIEILTQLSHNLGIGYQLRDDLLGMFGDELATGKSTVTDIKEGKRTYLIERFDVMANHEQSAAFFAVFHQQNADPLALEAAKQLLVDSGAKEAVEFEIDRHREEALEHIEKLSLKQDSKEVFINLVERCLTRDK